MNKLSLNYPVKRHTFLSKQCGLIVLGVRSYKLMPSYFSLACLEIVLSISKTEITRSAVNIFLKQSYVNFF